MPTEAKTEKSKLCLPIVQVGDPVLRQRAQDVQPSDIRTPEFRKLVDQMRETMRDASGVGLAAPQIGRSMRLVVIEDRAEYHEAIEPSRLAEIVREPVPFQVLINPTVSIAYTESEPRRHWEGCLSVSGFMAIVPRQYAIRISALDHHGDEFTLGVIGWYARIVQHELDHLNGVLYIERMVSRSFCTQDNYNEHWHPSKYPEAASSMK